MNEKKSGGYSGCGCSGFLLIVLAGLPFLFFARNFSPDVEDPQSTELPSAPNTIASPAKSKIVAPPETSAKILRVTLSPYNNFTTGGRNQQAYFVIRNTGGTMLRAVEAEITGMDQNGDVTHHVDSYTIYAAFDKERDGLKPNKTWRTPTGQGYLLPPATRSVKAKVTVTSDNNGIL